MGTSKKTKKLVKISEKQEEVTMMIDTISKPKANKARSQSKEPKRRDALKKEEKKSNKAKTKQAKELDPTKQALADSIEKQVSDLMDFSFNRIKHPDVDFITEDSLRKALYTHDITGVDDATLT